MLNFLYHLPNSYLFILISFTLISVSILGIFIVKYFVPINLLYKENPVIGSISALVSIIYGVFAGLTALYLINNLSSTADYVQREANSVANIYRDSNWLKDPARTKIHVQLTNYLDTVINEDWPLMKKGGIPSHQGDIIIGKVSQELGKYNPVTNAESLITRDMLEEIKSLYDAREARIHMSYSQLNTEIWIVLVMGTLLTIGINYFFGMNIYLHAISITIAAFMLASMTFLLVTLDRPFQGEFVIEVDAFKSVQEYIKLSDGINHSKSEWKPIK